MGKKMKLFPLLFKPSADHRHQPRSSWLWRSCSQPRTLSFRHATPDHIFTTINSAYLEAGEETPPENDDQNEQIEAVVRTLRRGERRLFLELEQTRSIMKECVVVSMESTEPYKDFKKSMAEMVEARGVKDWKGMEELLSWYLKANGKNNHEYIIGAFVDLLVGFVVNNNNVCGFCSSNDSSGSCSSFCSSCSCSGEVEEIECSSTAPCLYSLFEDDEEEQEELQHFNLSNDNLKNM